MNFLWTHFGIKHYLTLSYRRKYIMTKLDLLEVIEELVKMRLDAAKKVQINEKHLLELELLCLRTQAEQAARNSRRCELLRFIGRLTAEIGADTTGRELLLNRIKREDERIERLRRDFDEE